MITWKRSETFGYNYYRHNPKADIQRPTEKLFQRHDELDGYLYIGYPIIGTVDGVYPIDSLWVSPDKGLVIFNLIEGKNIDGYEEAQDDCANKIEAKLRGYRQLVNKRKLCVEINVITYAPALMRKVDCDEDYPLCANDNNLLAQIETLNWNNSGYYEALVSVLQAISTIRKGKTEGNHKARIQRLETESARGFHC